MAMGLPYDNISHDRGGDKFACNKCKCTVWRWVYHTTIHRMTGEGTSSPVIRVSVQYDGGFRKNQNASKPSNY